MIPWLPMRKKIVCAYCLLTAWEAAEETGIFIGSCHTILTNNLGMHSWAPFLHYDTKVQNCIFTLHCTDGETTVPHMIWDSISPASLLILKAYPTNGSKIILSLRRNEKDFIPSYFLSHFIVLKHNYKKYIKPFS